MSLTFRPLDEQAARAIMRWTYEAPYDIYNLESPQPEITLRYLLNPRYAFHGIFGPQDQLEGYCSFGQDAQVPGGDYATPALDIGLGIRPDLTGQGRGSEYVDALLKFANQKYSPQQLRVTIAAFNQRALRVWEKAGFQVIQRFQGGLHNTEFVVLMKLMI